MTKPALIVERSGSYYRVTAEAPHGFVWLAGRVHELVADGRGAGVAEARADVRARMGEGMIPCGNPTCDCYQERTDPLR